MLPRKFVQHDKCTTTHLAFVSCLHNVVVVDVQKTRDSLPDADIASLNTNTYVSGLPHTLVGIDHSSVSLVHLPTFD